MSRSPLVVVNLSSTHGHIVTRVDGSVVAWIYFYGAGSRKEYGYRLMNYDHKLSRRFEDLGKMLKEVEREVL